MKDMRDLLPAVRDQGVRGTCLTIAVTDGHHAVRACEPELSIDYLHYHAVRREECGINEGVSPSTLSEALFKDGQPAASACPYSAVVRDHAWSPPHTKGQIWKRQTTSHAPTWESIHTYLFCNEPIVLVLAITDEFWDASKTLIDKSVGPTRARHAVLAVRLHDTELWVFVRNSWGEEWGRNGYAWISADYIEAHCTSVITFGGEVP